jgi:hypothetical protein
MKKKIFVEAISFVVIILFLYTGISKLADYAVFREQVALSPVLQPFAGIIAWLLPLVEFAVAALLFIPKCRLTGLYAATGLMGIFTLYIAVLLAVDDTLPCSCGGIIELLSWKQHLVLNIAVTLLLAFAAKFHRETRQVPLLIKSLLII